MSQKEQKQKVRVTLTSQGSIILLAGKFGLFVLSDDEAEKLLYDLHSIVMTKRGHNLPAGRLRRFFRLLIQ